MPDKKKHDTLLRQLEMLRLIPKLPSPPMTSQQLRDGLATSSAWRDSRVSQNAYRYKSAA